MPRDCSAGPRALVRGRGRLRGPDLGTIGTHIITRTMTSGVCTSSTTWTTMNTMMKNSNYKSVKIIVRTATLVGINARNAKCTARSSSPRPSSPGCQTLLALLLTVVAAGGLYRYRRSPTRRPGRSDSSDARSAGGRRIHRPYWGGELQLQAKHGLRKIGHGRRRHQHLRGRLCAVALLRSIATVVGAAAVVLQRKYASAPASHPTTAEECASRHRSLRGRREGTRLLCRARRVRWLRRWPSAQVAEVGSILAVICLIVNCVFYTWVWVILKPSDYRLLRRARGGHRHLHPVALLSFYQSSRTRSGSLPHDQVSGARTALYRLRCVCCPSSTSWRSCA